MILPVLNECQITFFQVDRRFSAELRSNVVNHIITEKNANSIRELVYQYFSVIEEWDKKLLDAMFLDDIEFNMFELSKRDDPNINFGMVINGNRNIVFNSKVGLKYKVNKNFSNKIKVKTNLFLGSLKYELTRENIEKKINIDFSIIALHNCYSFNQFTAWSTDRGLFKNFQKVSI